MWASLLSILLISCTASMQNPAARIIADDSNSNDDDSKQKALKSKPKSRSNIARCAAWLSALTTLALVGDCDAANWELSSKGFKWSSTKVNRGDAAPTVPCAQCTKDADFYREAAVHHFDRCQQKCVNIVAPGMPWWRYNEGWGGWFCDEMGECMCQYARHTLQCVASRCRGSAEAKEAAVDEYCKGWNEVKAKGAALLKSDAAKSMQELFPCDCQAIANTECSV